MRVSVAMSVGAPVAVAEVCWYDTSRWPDWVEGLERVSEVSGEWPQAGATVTWESGPAGRGHVVERVLSYEPLAGQTVAVRDDSLTGQQTVSFTPTDGGAEVKLTLDYAVRRRTLLTPVVDRLFIRGAMQRSLSATLARFGVHLAERSQHR